jgi:hypothetical protein
LREWRDFVLSEVLVYWGFLEICKIRFWKREDISIEAPLGSLERSLFTGDFKRQSHIACRAHAVPKPFPCHFVLLRV